MCRYSFLFISVVCSLRPNYSFCQPNLGQYLPIDDCACLKFSRILTCSGRLTAASKSRNQYYPCFIFPRELSTLPLTLAYTVGQAMILLNVLPMSVGHIPFQAWQFMSCLLTGVGLLLFRGPSNNVTTFFYDSTFTGLELKSSSITFTTKGGVYGRLSPVNPITN